MGPDLDRGPSRPCRRKLETRFWLLVKAGSFATFIGKAMLMPDL